MTNSAQTEANFSFATPSTVTVSCTAGQKATGGGYYISYAPSIMDPSNTAVVGSRPSGADSWEVSYLSNGGDTVTAYVTCVS